MKIFKSMSALGRLGRKTRAKRLTFLRGKARAKSLQAARRIEQNFRYLKVIDTLAEKPHPVSRHKTFKGRLPGIYP